MAADKYLIDNFFHLPHTIPAATESSAGVMSAADKTKLDTLTPGDAGVVLNVRGFPGGDIGAKIQAANDFAGDAYCFMMVPWTADQNNNKWSTPVILNANKRLHLSVGFYDSSGMPSTGQVFLLLFRDNFTLTGDGWQTIIQQPHVLNTFGNYNNSVVSGDMPGATNVVLRDFQVVTPAVPQASSGGNGVVGIGNSTNVLVENIYFNGCYGIDVNLGANSNPFMGVSYHGSNICVSKTVHNWIADDRIKLACVNAFNWTFTDCILEGGCGIDIEPNQVEDVIVGFTIKGLVVRGGFLLVQGAATKDGTITGCSFVGDGTANSSTAISCLASSRIIIADNVIDGYYGGDVQLASAIVCIASLDCQISGNTIINCSNVSFTPNPANSAPISLAQGSARTIIRGNYVLSPVHGWSGIHEDATCSGTVLEYNYFGLGSGTLVTAKTDSGESVFLQITLASDGASLPQATINVISTTDCSNSGTLTVSTSSGDQTVTYTGKTSTSFTGCSGGTGTMSLGSLPDIVLSGRGSYARHNDIGLSSGSAPITVGGSEFAGYRVVSGNGQTFRLSDQIVGANTTSSACNITLPDPATAFYSLLSSSWQVTIQDVANNAGTNNITIHPFGSEKINGVAANKVISTNSGALTFFTNGTDWFAR